MSKRLGGINFRKLDIFGQSIGLRLEESNSSKTIIGAILSILAIFSILYIAFFSFLNLINHPDQSTTYMDIGNSEFPEFTFGKNQFTFAFLFQYEIFDIYELDIYKPVIKLIFPLSNKAIYLPYRKCTKEDFNDSVYLPILYDKYNCIDYDKIDEKISIFGSESEENSYLQFSLVQCLEGEKECRNYIPFFDGLISEVGYSSIEFLLKEGIIDPMNYTHPISFDYKHFSMRLKQGYTESAYFKLRKIEVETDNGWLFENSEKEYSFEIKEYISFTSSLSTFYDDTPNSYALLYLESANNIHKVKRIYKKMWSVFYEIGGIIGILVHLCPIIDYFFSETYLNEKIINQMFYFEPPNDKENAYKHKISVTKKNNQENNKLYLCKENFCLSIINREKKKICETEQLNKEHPKTEEKLIFRENNNEQNALKGEELTTNRKLIYQENSSSKNDNNKNNTHNINKIDNYTNERKNLKLDQQLSEKINKFLDQKKGISLSYGQIMKINCCSCCLSKKNNQKEKYYLYSKSKKIIEKCRDILYLITVLNEFEKMKYILLSKEQLALFKFISNDTFSLNESSPEAIKDYENNEKIKHICIDYLEKLKNNSIVTNEIDNRLLNYIKNY